VAIVHELSWSVSRSGTFAECRRRYYYDYYLSWRGWGRDADPARQRAYLLKKMTRMPMWAGDCLHQALAHYFDERRFGAEPTEEELRTWALDKLREGYKQSRDGVWKRRPAKLTHLAEHHYDEDSVDEPSGNAREYGTRYVERIEAGVREFCRSPELAAVRESDPKSWLACEELGTIELFGVKVYAVPDFALRPADGAAEVAIYDWKTGSPREQDRFQLALYAVYARDQWQADPERVRCVDAYLPRGEYAEARFDGGELEAVLERVETSIRAMQELHFDADASAGDPDAFPPIPADAAAARACRTCNYRELCGR